MEGILFMRLEPEPIRFRGAGVSAFSGNFGNNREKSREFPNSV
jgi:hypothetical protein